MNAHEKARLRSMLETLSEAGPGGGAPLLIEEVLEFVVTLIPGQWQREIAMRQFQAQREQAVRRVTGRS